VKILHISTNLQGGAARAMVRLHKALLNSNVDSKILVLHPTESRSLPPETYFYLHHRNVFQIISEAVGYRLYARRRRQAKTAIGTFTFPTSNYTITKHPIYAQSDIINLHWVANFIDYPSFFRKNNKPVVWTLHDENPIMGGFHYHSDYVLNNKSLKEKEHKIRDYKKSILSKVNNMAIVALSRWLLKASKASEAMKNKPHHLIPNGLETEVFLPYNKGEEKRHFGLPEDKISILFVADSLNDKRKGFEILQKALPFVDLSKTQLITIGGTNSLPTQSVHLGKINDDHLLAKAYSAADIFVIPSLQDNLPNTVLEAMACATPVVGFNTGGIPDMVINNETGLLANVGDEKALASKINYLINNPEQRKNMGVLGRKLVEEKFGLGIQSKAYIQVYQSLLNT